MPFARLAAAPTPVSRIGLGLAAVGRPGYLNLGRDRDLPPGRSVEELRTRAHDLLDAAYEQGVRYVDTARSYGRAEEFLAGWLAAHPQATDLVVGSKWGYTYTAGWRTQADSHEVKNHALATYERQITETRDLLGDRLDLYQIHSLTPESPALTDRALHERLAALGAEGVTIGCSVSGPDQAAAIHAALAVEVAGQPLFRTIQATYNVYEHSAGPALEAAHGAGRSVLVKEALANGRLAGEAAPPAVRGIAGELSTTPDAVALAFVLRAPWVEVALSGAATVAQLDTNLRALALPLDEERLERLDALGEEAGEYWRTRAGMPWG
ncbi:MULTISPECIES: aldo/keto reductase [unclassified Streptomyces]|uniref:Aldo/keto reductase n=1 Tax=Streptomyces evansiae TaxID=3075535 RepID=A0ABU2R1P8_9ACTN|nr:MULTISPECIES: aldo/keto reductase [unclassified Streptomyces]MDT0410545.1 aldo/keto reductase [Streptomyces sp. DSM 41979]MYQ56715.1 aldo/keto reductase [Streptomyces sp. SID4926]MYR27945.1 aldo/keto reductase [Streptomyces sp. SID4945]SCD57164.1 Predicted oxidoreductase [Streptomyces sp. DfronAA-171]SCE12453.1 Predicted oxidoreductase [Streptomyces sp. TverLS-915]